MIESFAVMKPQKTDTIPTDCEKYVYQEKIDGGNVVVDVELPNVKIYHARTIGSKITFNERAYRYPELVNEIRQGVLKDGATYIGELTVLDKQGVGRLWLFGQRSHLENQFQIQRMSKLCPVTFYPHHVIRDGNDLLFDVPYIDILRMLKLMVRNGEHIREIPSYPSPDQLLAREGIIEGIVVKDVYGIYHRGKRGMGWLKKKFLQEKNVKFISYIVKEVGINLFTDDNKEIHLAGDRVAGAVEEIKNKGFVNAEIEYMAETTQGFRDCSIKRIGNELEAEI